METTSEQDLRVRNVRLWQRKKAVTGTLKLKKNHLVFEYSLEESNGRTGVSERGSTDRPSTTRASDVSAQQARSSYKQPTKEIYIAYPMINRCLLRPSYLQGLPQRPSNHAENELAESNEDFFPPTLGSADFPRPSTDSRHSVARDSLQRPAVADPSSQDDTVPLDTGRSPAVRIRCRDFRMMAFHFHAGSRDKTADELAREVFFTLRRRCCVDGIEDLYAFEFNPPSQEKAAEVPLYSAQKEFKRMGIGGKSAEGPGSAWRISDINQNYGFSATYPSVLCVPRAVSDNMLKYGGSFRSRSRIPALAYLHFNGGSITRSSQPMVGVQGKRNPQDERLVSAIFSSHTPPITPPDEMVQPVSGAESSGASVDVNGDEESEPVAPEPEISAHQRSQSETALGGNHETSTGAVKRKVFGSTRKNLIIDARPKINALANRATGGGIEDVSNYLGPADVPVERIFLNIQNIHVMRASLEKVVESFANSDYLELKPDQEMLRKSGWLGHLSNLLEGSEQVARAVGLTGSHVLVHCSDGWDRTAQVSALAQIMLDPHYRTLDGFVTLIQKDFLSFGHKFRDRNGIRGCEKWFEIENERIPAGKQQEARASEPNSLNVLGSKALSGARSWFEKNRGSLFRQQNISHESLQSASPRPESPPPNPIIHSPPTKDNKEDRGHKTDEKEIAPIFHQFLEAVWQLQRQFPNAFEFNERLLLRILYQTYACQYGEFLFNCERERVECDQKRAREGKKPLPSVWMHFLARRAEFVNREYAADQFDSLLLPKRGSDRQVEVRWWSRLFGRDDKEMNVPAALAPSVSSTMYQGRSSISVDEATTAGLETQALDAADPGTSLRGAKSTPNLAVMEQGGTELSPDLSALDLQSASTAGEPGHQRPPLLQQETDLEVLARYSATSPPPSAGTSQPIPSSTDDTGSRQEVQSDSLGVASGAKPTQAMQGGGLDFATFASQNAYRDR
ncbi:protein phosphatase [Hortaea werneckii]|nr:protein phosphatase [Hortaea werneckii]